MPKKGKKKGSKTEAVAKPDGDQQEEIKDVCASYLII